jgi:hypothetical protein
MKVLEPREGRTRIELLGRNAEMGAEAVSAMAARIRGAVVCQT